MITKKIRVSSSISNWKDKILTRYGLKEASFLNDLFGPIIFFGCYNWRDYLRIVLHRGKRTIFWCGSDLRDLNWCKRVIISLIKARHIVETKHGEASQLEMMGIEPEILPQFFSDPEDFQPCFRPSKTPHVFLNVHPDREKEYGLELIRKIAPFVPEVTFHIYGVSDFLDLDDKNVVYHGRMPEERFNYEIKFMQAGLRLNHFDGNSEVVMKSILLGQYPITYLIYPDIPSYNNERELLALLVELKNKKAANPMSQAWRERLNQTKNVLLQIAQNQISNFGYSCTLETLLPLQ